MADLLPGFVTLLALAFYFYTVFMVGLARGKHKVAAPAVTGPPEFERTLRVQMNTLEWMPLFLPALWLFSVYVEPVIASGVGLVWILGRFMYARGYISAAEKRGTGFLVQGLALLVLFLGALSGLIWKALGLAPLLAGPLL